MKRFSIQEHPLTWKENVLRPGDLPEYKHVSTRSFFNSKK
jgi:hypothetical protein